jgi:hypothetical protein
MTLLSKEITAAARALSAEFADGAQNGVAN